MKPVVVDLEEAGGSDYSPAPEILPNLPPLHTLLKVSTTTVSSVITSVLCTV